VQDRLVRRHLRALVTVAVIPAKERVKKIDKPGAPPSTVRDVLRALDFDLVARVYAETPGAFSIAIDEGVRDTESRE